MQLEQYFGYNADDICKYINFTEYIYGISFPNFEWMNN